MTFKQLEFFILVCQYESIARVAELNFVSSQSISRMIKDLESELETSLFTRANNRITLTKPGEYFRDECIEILEKKETLVQNIKEMTTQSKTTINIGMAMGSLAALNYHVFDEFQVAHPCSIQYKELIDSELEQQFLNNEFDLCVTTHPFDETLYHNAMLITEKVCVSIPQQHPLYNVDTITMEDLRSHEFVMFSNSYHISQKFNDCFKSAGFDPIIKISLDDFNSIKNLAYQNNLLSLDVQHSLKKEYGFRHIPFPCSDLSHEYWIIQKKVNSPAIIEELFQYIVNNI